MLTTKINEKGYALLERLFNEYCEIIYGKHYPVTDNNIKTYYQEALIHYYGKDNFSDEDKIIKSFNNINEDEFLVYDYYLILHNELRMYNKLEIYNNALKNVNNNN